ncbi:glycosyltransferase family 4 protein [Lacrimispora brassicae]
MKIIYVGTRLQVNGATKVAISHCNILHKRGHQVRLAVLGANSLDWSSPFIPVEYISNLRMLHIDEKELIVVLDCLVANWFVRQYGHNRVISFVQVDEPKLYHDPQLVNAAQNAFALSNPKIVVSKYLQDILKEYGSNSEIIPPAISKAIYYPAKRDAPEVSKPFKVLLVGSYSHPLKQIPQAYLALKYLQHLGVDVRLIRLVRKVETVTPVGLEVEWFVNPPQDMIGEIYRSADALLSASSSEGFGLPLLEAMATGIPFVTTDNGGSRDLIPDQSLVVKVGDTAAMGRALYQLASDRTVWQHLRTAGLERAERWSWDYIGIELERYFKVVCGTAFKKWRMIKND